jgi:hypothetical protein
MRVHREIEKLLRGTDHERRSPTPATARERATATDGDRLTGLLAAVLVDPNLHTDTRMRLHREIPALLRAAGDPRAVAGAARASAHNHPADERTR